MHHQIPKSDNTHTKQDTVDDSHFLLTIAESERKTKTSRLVSEIEMCYVCCLFSFFFKLNLSLIVFFMF